MLQPDKSECCGSGCNPCIFDVYEKQLKKQTTNNSNQKKNNCISTTSYSIFILTDIENDSSNSFIYTFRYLKKHFDPEIDQEDKEIVITAGQHFLLRGEVGTTDNKYFTRAYTPILDHNLKDKKCFKVLIKLYENGLMSNYIKTLKINSETLWRGPYCDFKIDYNLKHLFMIAQGTGIAPIFSIIQKILENEDCETFLKLFYCCRNVGTIHLRKKVHDLSSFWNFTYQIFLSREENTVLDTRYNEIIKNTRLGKSDFEKYIIKNNLIGVNNYQILICGTDIFCVEIKNILEAFKMLNQKIYVF